MKLVEFTRDMRPWAANHTYALPDDAAAALIAAGDARPAPGGDAGLAPDDLVPAKAGLSGPRPLPPAAAGRYLQRGKK